MTSRVSSSRSASALVELAGHRVPREHQAVEHQQPVGDPQPLRLGPRLRDRPPHLARAGPARPARPPAGSARRPPPCSLPVCRASSSASVPSRSRSAAVRGHHSGDERDLAGVHEQRRVAEPAGHRERLVDQRPALLERRGVVELVRRPSMHRHRSGESSGGSVSRLRRSAPTISSCTSPWAADCHSAPWVVAIAASATSTGSPISLGHARPPARRWRSARPTSPPSGTPRPAP